MTKTKIIIDPRSVPFNIWAGQIASDNPSFPSPFGEVRWKDWAARVCAVNGNAPTPTNYDDWRNWAIDWMRAL